MQLQRTFKNTFYSIKTKGEANYYQDTPISKTIQGTITVSSATAGQSPVQLPHLEILPSESTTQLVRDYPEQCHEQILQGSHSIKLAVIQGCIQLISSFPPSLPTVIFIQ